ncbi:MAG: aconitate hydratase [Betaproteobacteria bacterium RIFCSPLOWO2_12_FULL_62_58]|nr:MAG: aconitate hydratase [Betaproteobacteria bacterium RIFCSPLOWO2_12_FULL_62_58]
MVTIESTPEMAGKVYETMAKNLNVVRRRLGKPLTLADKVLLGHLDDPERQDLQPGKSYLFLRPDRVVFQDVLGQTGLLQFMQTRRDQVAVPTTIHCDHLIQARVEGERDLRESLAENTEVYDFLRSAAAKYGAGFWEPGAGIIHQVVLENYAFPGELIIGTDSHTPNAGGLGACSVGVGGADAVETIAGLPWEVLYPKHICVYLTGKMSGWTAPKDVILYVAGQLTVSGGTNAIVEYIGPGARTISATGKATITNMGAELGATTSMFPADEHMAKYLRATGRGALVPLMEKHIDLLQPDPEVEADPEKYYDRVVRLDLSTLEPHVVGPHSPDRARPISKLAAEVSDADNKFLDRISSALIGSCTNSSYEDMSRAADVAEQAKAHGVKSAVPFLVTPGSEQVRATIERDGQMQSLKDIDGTVLANACGPCIGQWRRARKVAAVPNTIVTSYNRNFPARNDGQATTMNFIASPEIVTAFALSGKLSFNPLTDPLIGADGQPFKLNPPKPAPEVPAKNFDRGHANYIAPPADGSRVMLSVDPKSQRLQLMQPWPAWDGKDFVDVPVLLKTKGKTTTDHISPAGPWLRFRGHLDKFSDNMCMGAINAYTGEAGKVKNVLTSATGEMVSKVARDYKAKGVKWVIVGDANYGEGSSREHAALSPRLLGGVAVIVRSFARIHESNLKKQGLLALTFQSPADYDRIREDDRLSLVGLNALAPGKPVECRVKHADGTTEMLKLNHTFSGPQLEWFRKGSALNLFHGAAKKPAAKKKAAVARKRPAKKTVAAKKMGGKTAATKSAGKAKKKPATAKKKRGAKKPTKKRAAKK